ncbi:MAG: TOBE domain-containing protein [Campylobacteraceae bacterium]|jgi:molybdopterin-binding protein|nr:TOBE domain-containing protein [Campylobacteraceae bacterium]
MQRRFRAGNPARSLPLSKNKRNSGVSPFQSLHKKGWQPLDFYYFSLFLQSLFVFSIFLILCKIDNYDEFERILNRKTLRTSARNQLYGKITAIKKEGLMIVIETDVDGILIKASITVKSAEELALKTGSFVWLIIKASWIEIAQDEGENVFNAVVSASETKANSVENSFIVEDKIIVVAMSATPLEIGEKVKIFIDKSKIIVGI